jgi:enoyl-CoA hydratase/carnithine racemase
MSTSFGPFTVTENDGVALVIFDRPPVNALDLATYQALGDLITHIEASNDIAVAVLAAPDDARCWCGGADVNDFKDMTAEKRKERYTFINSVFPRFYNLKRPIIAAINGPAVGIGLQLAASCDLRVASHKARFSSPELKYGLIAGSSRTLNYLGVPEGVVRELAYTGRSIDAATMNGYGFLNRLVAPDELIPCVMELASQVAERGPTMLAARKRAFLAHETLSTLEAYEYAQGISSELVAMREAQAGVDDFLRK